MKILSISDFHGSVDTIEKLKEVVKAESPDVIVFSGDIVKGKIRGNEWHAAMKENREPRWKKEMEEEEEEDLDLYRTFYRSLNELGIPVLCVPGNMDAPKNRYETMIHDAEDHYENIHNVHNCEFRHGGYTFRGFGGELTLDLREDTFVYMCRGIDVHKRVREKGDNLIIITHSPPVGDEVSIINGEQKGSPVVNDIIEQAKPIVLFCGHAHKPGQETISGAKVVNPGPLKKLNYALAVIEGDDITIEHKTLE
jgi:Icc-related predicted phosphoesterase